MKTIGMSLSLLSIFAAGGAAAGDTEYTSFSTWAPNVSGVTTYAIGGLPPDQPVGGVGGTPVNFGPGTFTAASGYGGYIYNDDFYGNGVQYFADSGLGAGPPGNFGVTVSFSASADITALAFDIGTYNGASNVDISVNGSALSPVFVSGGAPASAFFGVTDKSGPITSIKFTAVSTDELDLISSFSTAKARSAAITAPEVDANSAAGALTLLLGGLAVLRGRRVAVSVKSVAPYQA